MLVLNAEEWQKVQQEKGFASGDLSNEKLHTFLLDKVSKQIEAFPGYAKIRKVVAIEEEWSVEEGLITPTLKVKRPKVLKKFSTEIAAMYDGHGIKTGEADS